MTIFSRKLYSIMAIIMMTGSLVMAQTYDLVILNGRVRSSDSLLEPLSEREIEVLVLMAEGLKNKEIAAKLYLEYETVKKHIYNIYQKLDVHSRVHALRKARLLEILSEGETPQ